MAKFKIVASSHYVACEREFKSERGMTSYLRKLRSIHRLNLIHDTQRQYRNHWCLNYAHRRARLYPLKISVIRMEGGSHD